MRARGEERQRLKGRTYHQVNRFLLGHVGSENLDRAEQVTESPVLIARGLVPVERCVPERPDASARAGRPHEMASRCGARAGNDEAPSLALAPCKTRSWPCGWSTKDRPARTSRMTFLSAGTHASRASTRMLQAVGSDMSALIPAYRPHPLLAGNTWRGGVSALRFSPPSREGGARCSGRAPWCWQWRARSEQARAASPSLPFSCMRADEGPGCGDAGTRLRAV